MSSRRGRLLSGLTLAVLLAHLPLVWYAGLTGSLAYFVTGFAARPLVLLSLLWLAADGFGRWDSGRPQALPHFWAAAAILCLTSAYVASPLLLTVGDLGTQARVRGICGEDRLQRWAEALLAKPTAQLPLASRPYAAGRLQLDPARLPDFVRRLPAERLCFAFVCTDEAGARYVWISVWGGRPHAFGVLVGTRAFRPRPQRSLWTRRWAPGLYGWQAQGEVY